MVKRWQNQHLNTSSWTSESVFLVTRFLMSVVTYRKLNKERTRNKSEEIYLKEFDSIRNVRPEYMPYSFI